MWNKSASKKWEDFDERQTGCLLGATDVGARKNCFEVDLLGGSLLIVVAPRMRFLCVNIVLI